MNLRNPLEKGEKGPRSAPSRVSPGGKGEERTTRKWLSIRLPVGKSCARKRRGPGGGKKKWPRKLDCFLTCRDAKEWSEQRSLSAWNEKFPQRNLKRTLELERGSNIHRKQKKGTPLTNFMEGPLAGNLPPPQNRKEGAISGGGRRSAVCAWGINCNSDPPTLQGVLGISWRGLRDATYPMLGLNRSPSSDPLFPP